MQTQTQQTAAGEQSGLRTRPIGDALGADVLDVNVAEVDDASYPAIRQALVDNLVLRFRGQELTDADLVAFSRRFGDLDMAPAMENDCVAQDIPPEILVISNVKENGVAIGSLGDGEAIWHSDMNYAELPPLGSLLYALEVPKTGGNTGFCNMYKALEALPEDLRRRVEGLSIKHDASINSGGYVRAGMEEVTDVTTAPGAIHPIVRTHPESGRQSLFLGRRRNAYVMGLPVGESEALLDELWQHGVRDAFTWHQEWQVGDVVMWDNRCTMHRRDSFDPGARRIMHRTQIGDRPAAA